MIFVAPAFFPISALFPSHRVIMHINPPKSVIGYGRKLLPYRQLPKWGRWASYMAVGTTKAWDGRWWFQTTGRGFADAI